MEELSFTLMGPWRHRKEWLVVVHAILSIFKSHLLVFRDSTHSAEKREFPTRYSSFLILWTLLELHPRIFLIPLNT